MNIGIDIGGSHIGVGVVSPDGKILKRLKKILLILKKII